LAEPPKRRLMAAQEVAFEFSAVLSVYYIQTGSLIVMHERQDEHA